MNRFNARLCAAGVLAVGMFGCKSGGSAASGYVPKTTAPLSPAMVQSGQEASYFPFAEGSQWTFDSTMKRMLNGQEQNPINQEVTYKIIKVAPSPTGGQDATFQVLGGGQVMDEQIWRADKTGLYQVALGKKLNRFSTPQMVLPFPVKQGQVFKWKGSVNADSGELRSGESSSTVVGEQPIDTPMGNFNALAVQSTSTLNAPTSKSKVDSTVWFVPGVGIGRYLQTATGELTSKDPKFKGQKISFGIIQTLKLKNYTLKK